MVPRPRSFRTTPFPRLGESEYDALADAAELSGVTLDIVDDWRWSWRRGFGTEAVDTGRSLKPLMDANILSCREGLRLPQELTGLFVLTVGGLK